VLQVWGKWRANHKCPEQIPLHVLEEILDALEEGDCAESDDSKKVEGDEDIVLAIGQPKDLAPSRRKTLKICGRVGKLDVLILIDSGSVGTFISEQLAGQLQVDAVECAPTQFMAADGGPMVCTHKVIDLPWSAKGYSFTSTTGILLLRCFDMILG